MPVKESFYLNRVEYKYSDLESWDVERLTSLIAEIQEKENAKSFFVKDGQTNCQSRDEIPTENDYRAARYYLAQLCSARQRVSAIRKNKKETKAHELVKRSRNIGDYYMMASHQMLPEGLYSEILKEAQRIQSEDAEYELSGILKGAEQ